MRNALRTVDIRLIDHLVTGTRYVYSFTADAVIDVKEERVLTPAEYTSKARAQKQCAKEEHTIDRKDAEER